jgi:hypothetical protein
MAAVLTYETSMTWVVVVMLSKGSKNLVGVPERRTRDFERLLVEAAEQFGKGGH